MNISQLETLITLSKTMSFRKTGEQLNLTQPAVSAQIKTLEDEFQITLIDRSQPVSLTDQGRLFLEHAQKILRVVDELKQKITDLNEIPQGHISLGTTTSIAIQILPRVLSYFQDQYPLINTAIYSMSSSQIFANVDNGTIDIGIGYLSGEHPNVETSVLYYDTFELVVSPEHHLSQYSQITVDQLRDIPFILLSSDTVGRRFAEQVFKQYHIQPHVVMELSSSEEIKRMVEINLGAAIISKLAVSEELRRGSLKIVRVTDFETTHPVGLMYKSGRYLNSAIQQFLRDLKGMPETQFICSE